MNLRRTIKDFEKLVRIARVRGLSCARELAVVRTNLHLPRNDIFEPGTTADDSVKIHWLDPEETFSRPLPKLPGETAPHWVFQKEQNGSSPATFVAEFRRGRFWGFYGGSVFTEDGRLVPDLSKDVWGPHLHSAFVRCRLPAPRRISGRVLSLVTPEAEANYYHWTLDFIPRGGLVSRAGFAIDEFDHVLIKDRQLPYQHEALAKLGVTENKIIRVNDSTHIQADTLVVPSIRLDNTRVPRSDLEFINRLYLPAPASSARRRLYVSRRDAAFRRITNEAELLPILKKHGFEEISMSGLSVADQARLFSEAEAVIGPNGAAFANLVFAPSHCRVIELFAPNWVVPYFWMICAGRKLDYTALIGQGPRPPSGVLPSGLKDDIHIDPAHLKLALAGLPPPWNQ